MQAGTFHSPGMVSLLESTLVHFSRILSSKAVWDCSVGSKKDKMGGDYAKGRQQFLPSRTYQEQLAHTLQEGGQALGRRDNLSTSGRGGGGCADEPSWTVEEGHFCHQQPPSSGGPDPTETRWAVTSTPASGGAVVTPQRQEKARGHAPGGWAGSGRPASSSCGKPRTRHLPWRARLAGQCQSQRHLPWWCPCIGATGGVSREVGWCQWKRG